MLVKVVGQDRDQPGQVVAVVVDQDQVIDVASVEANPQITLDEMIEGVQVKVGEDLAGQVPDR
jgi:hypothetical protein